ncbi:hypothetical protein [Helicobacter sp. 11S02596-1]|uniref:hypothetical protein n=1 Tax=Helicobacter sp. 11S02596-1 TaxID=1476194 RepID=UPI000BA4EE85|nr:hypothetical protein [Helicobacter sp. 11S02596-1]PAF43177.1 hypothetical protein BJI48_05380 [Helicobacter sp. 11S02596-1]
MEINSQLPKTSLYNLLGSQQGKNENTPIQTQPAQKPQKLAEIPKNKETQADTQGISEKRETYGLLVLELMNDNEYEAFQRATAGMNEGEKMLAAQSLYSLTSFYNGKRSPEMQDEPDFYTKNAQKAFGIQPQNLNNFLERYKNAYSTLQNVDIVL